MPGTVLGARTTNTNKTKFPDFMDMKDYSNRIKKYIFFKKYF